MELTKRVASGTMAARGGTFVHRGLASLGDAQAPCLAVVRVQNGRFAWN